MIEADLAPIIDTLKKLCHEYAQYRIGGHRYSDEQLAFYHDKLFAYTIIIADKMLFKVNKQITFDRLVDRVKLDNERCWVCRTTLPGDTDTYTKCVDDLQISCQEFVDTVKAIYG